MYISDESFTLPAYATFLRLIFYLADNFMYFFFSSRRRHTRSVSAFLLNRSSDLGSPFSRSGWLWPVDAKGEPLKATSYMAVGFYVAKYVNKKSDMDLAAKGLGEIGRASCRERV